MSLKDLSLHHTYWSGENNLIEDFYIPCLSTSIYYDRAVGFFSSSILQYICEGLYTFISNGGKIRLICSTELTEHDREQIKRGYDIRDIVENKFTETIEDILIDYDKPNVKNLCWLIKNNRLDIKVCIREWNSGSPLQATLFHEKFGIFKDKYGNIISFLGSINESVRGWMFNEESFEVSVSWKQVLQQRILDKIQRFENLWSGTAKSVKTYNFPDALKNKLIQNAPNEPIDALSESLFKSPKLVPSFTPRKCQEDAKRKFQESDYCCLYQMATGAGKTKAALYSLVNISEWKLLLILVPGIELVYQWEKDVNLFYHDYYIIKCGSDYSKWKEQLLDLIQARIPEKTIIISTYDSAISDFSMDKWQSVKSKDFVLICDEAHNLGALQTQRIMQLKPKYSIGLSATPIRNFDEEGTARILEFYNNNIYTFSIRDAIMSDFLVNYEYKVVPCFLEDDEWNKYKQLTSDIIKLKANFKQNASEDKNKYKDDKEDRIKKKYMERAEILKTANNKLALFDTILNELPEGCRILIYADSKEHLKDYAMVLDSIRKNYFIYTGDKDSKVERPKMLEEFKLGVRKILLAIGCLDEGVDIPVCDAAIFISSSTSERQFIQRRGRVLRRSPGKTRAYIFDYLVIPDYNKADNDERKLAKQLVMSEYQRINLIAEDAINGIITRNSLDNILEKLGLNPYQY